MEEAGIGESFKWLSGTFIQARKFQLSLNPGFKNMSFKKLIEHHLLKVIIFTSNEARYD